MRHGIPHGISGSMMKPEPDKPKRDPTAPEIAHCSNPRYGAMTIAEATRLFMREG